MEKVEDPFVTQATTLVLHIDPRSTANTTRHLAELRDYKRLEYLRIVVPAAGKQMYERIEWLAYGCYAANPKLKHLVIGGWGPQYTYQFHDMYNIVIPGMKLLRCFMIFACGLRSRACKLPSDILRRIYTDVLGCYNEGHRVYVKCAVCMGYYGKEIVCWC